MQLSVEEILNYKRLHAYLRPETRAMLDTQLQARLAAPWTCVVVVLIAIPFGVDSNLSNNGLSTAKPFGIFTSLGVRPCRAETVQRN